MMFPAVRRAVLIVEDNETCAVTLQIALESLPNVEVLISPSAKSALRVLESSEHCVAAVITDLQLPGMSGIDLLLQLRTEARFASMPVFIISGDSDPRLPAQAIAYGAAAFFTKPYSPSEVRKKLEQLIT